MIPCQSVLCKKVMWLSIVMWLGVVMWIRTLILHILIWFLSKFSHWIPNVQKYNFANMFRSLKVIPLWLELAPTPVFSPQEIVFHDIDPLCYLYPPTEPIPSSTRWQCLDCPMLQRPPNVNYDIIWQHSQQQWDVDSTWLQCWNVMITLTHRQHNSWTSSLTRL